VIAASRVAIVHDYLTQRGGAERVVLSMARAFPEAVVYTSFYDPAATFPEFAEVEVRTAPIDHVAALRRRHRWALPVLAPTFSALKVDADVALCSSSGWAHGVRATGTKVVYCHAPARWLYQTDAYLAGAGFDTTTAVKTLAPALRRWDQRAARSADRYVVNSHHTQRLVRETYDLDAEVLFPPPGLSTGGPSEPVAGVQPAFFLCVARLLPYKHVDAVVDAFAEMPSERLVVVGSGPEAEGLRARAAANVRFLHEVTDAQLRWLYSSARALIAASYEDFGLTPIEAAAFGTPTLALSHGGYLDTVIEGTTGTFFAEPSASSIAQSVRSFDPVDFTSEKLREHAAGFGESQFAARLHDLVDECR
jgi:glycosyltransferase involved in cell wall biosynthesis